jgi:hypothetical protein
MYKISAAKSRPELQGLWDGLVWSAVDRLELANFRAEGSDHRPKTSVRLLHNEEGIFGIFRVEDRYVRCLRTRYGESVYKDSCVEFFVKPKSDKGYFNFEFNCGGAMLCSYIKNPERTPDGFKEYVLIPETEGRVVEIHHSMPRVVEPEIAGTVIWTIEFFIPLSLLEKYVGPIGDPRGQEWTANFYKCGDETSHPHWVSWQPLPKLNFHMPRHFGNIRFSRQSEDK